MKAKRIITLSLHGVIGVIVSFVAAVFLISYFFKVDLVKPYVIQSGSMEPAIKLASVVFSVPQKTYNPGDIITFAPNGNHKNLVTHRIDFKLYPDGIHNEPVYITSGDANDDFDRWETKNEHIVGRAVASIPYLGYLVDFAKKPQGFILLVIIPATIVIYEELRFLKKEMGEPLGKLREKAKRRGLIKRKEEITIRTINLVPKKQKEGIAKASILIPVIGSILVLVAVSAAFFIDIEKSEDNVIGVAETFD